MLLKPADDKHRLPRLAISTLVVSISFWYIGANLLNCLVKVQDYPWRASFDFLPLCGAMILLTFYYLTAGSVFAYLASQAHAQVKLLEGLRVFLVTNLGKYLPGMVWVALGKIYWLTRRGVKRSVAASIAGLEIGLNVAACMFVSVPILHWLLPSHSAGARAALGALIVPVSLCFWSPVQRMIARIAPRLDIPVSARVGRRAFLAYSCSWFILGLAFWLLVRAVYPVPLDRLLLALGSLGTAWLVGFLVIFAPGGVGVRESVLLGLLKCWLPLEIATVIAIGSRIWMTVGELLGLLVVYAIQPRN